MYRSIFLMNIDKMYRPIFLMNILFKNIIKSNATIC